MIRHLFQVTQRTRVTKVISSFQWVSLGSFMRTSATLKTKKGPSVEEGSNCRPPSPQDKTQAILFLKTVCIPPRFKGPQLKGLF